MRVKTFHNTIIKITVTIKEQNGHCNKTGIQLKKMKKKLQRGDNVCRCSMNGDYSVPNSKHVNSKKYLVIVYIQIKTSEYP